MNKYSVWYMPYNKRYLITHPWQWVRCAYRNIRDAWRRSVYGWTYGDVWDWDNWFTHVVPDMLRHMADKGSAYPGIEPFDTPEKWHDWLQHMAYLIETANEEWQDEHNEFYRDYMDHIWENDKERFNKYFERAKELCESGQKNVTQAMKEMGEHFHCLWD